MSRVQDLEPDLASLCQEAQGLGAAQAVPLPAAEIVVDERAWLKCLVPLCPHYGRDLLCPPSVLPVSQFREALRNYRHALLVKVDVPPSNPGEEKERSRFKASKLKLYEIIHRLEASCLQKGYPFAAGLVAGSCNLCEECVGVGSGLPCRQPFRARPAMEALGIDVLTTAKKAGLTLSFAPEAGRSWVGLLLIC